MKEVREDHLNDITGIQTAMLPESSIFLSVHYLGGIALVYECDKTEREEPRKNFTFHIVAGFDFVPDTALYIGSVLYDFSLLHVYRER